MREDLIGKLREEEFGGNEIDWQVSKRRGERMPFAETSRTYFFRMKDTGTIIVQPKKPDNAMPSCYSCQGEIITVVRNADITDNNEAGSGSPFYQEWIGQSLPVAIPYCSNCDSEPQGNQRFSSVEEFHHTYGKDFKEILPTQDTLRRR